MGGNGQIFKFSCGKVVREQVTSRIGFVTCRWNTQFLHPVDHTVITDMCGKIKFTARLNKFHMTLTLHNGFKPLFSAHFSQVAQVLNLFSLGIK